PLVAWGMAALLVAAGIAFTPVQRHYGQRRYNPYPAPLAAQVAWARPQRGLRIGTDGFPDIYPFAGLALANQVVAIGVRGADATFSEATTCTQWRRAVDQAGVDAVVLPPGDLGRRHATWATTDAGAVPVPGTASVFLIRHPL